MYFLGAWHTSDTRVAVSPSVRSRFAGLGLCRRVLRSRSRASCRPSNRFSAITAARERNSPAIKSSTMAKTTVRDRVTRLSCKDNVDVEALVTGYCKAIPHVFAIFSGAQAQIDPESRCAIAVASSPRRAPPSLFLGKSCGSGTHALLARLLLDDAPNWLDIQIRAANSQGLRGAACSRSANQPPRHPVALRLAPHTRAASPELTLSGSPRTRHGPGIE
jgi:hypothetical protein